VRRKSRGGAGERSNVDQKKKRGQLEGRSQGVVGKKKKDKCRGGGGETGEKKGKKSRKKDGKSAGLVRPGREPTKKVLGRVVYNGEHQSDASAGEKKSGERGGKSDPK